MGEVKLKGCRIGAWNVRSMYEGKLAVVKQEMIALNITLLRISELGWTGLGEFQSEEYKIIYSGNESIKRRGVARICDRS